MLKNFNQNKFKFEFTGEPGLPENYPTPNVHDLAFYIQRNHNRNTIIYTLNKEADGRLCQEEPLNVCWLRYCQEGQIQDLNKIQIKLAYGYKSWKLNSETFKFQMVAYPKQNFFLARDDMGQFRVSTQLEDKMTCISNIYVYAEDFGVFPQVKYIEFYGHSINEEFPTYKKIFV